ncbi:hypothetical protein FSOLCH5_000338 [Fusarium solani]
MGRPLTPKQDTTGLAHTIVARTTPPWTIASYSRPYVLTHYLPTPALSSPRALYAAIDMFDTSSSQSVVSARPVLHPARPSHPMDPCPHIVSWPLMHLFISLTCFSISLPPSRSNFPLSLLHLPKSSPMTIFVPPPPPLPNEPH